MGILFYLGCLMFLKTKHKMINKKAKKNSPPRIVKSNTQVSIVMEPINLKIPENKRKKIGQ